jgi:hypothetical protein
MRFWLDVGVGLVLLGSFFALVILIIVFPDQKIVRDVFIGPGFLLTFVWIGLLGALSFTAPKIVSFLLKLLEKPKS